MWKFQDFSVILIFLHKINFEESRGSKIAVFAILVTLKMINLLNFSRQKVQKSINSKFGASEMC